MERVVRHLVEVELVDWFSVLPERCLAPRDGVVCAQLAIVQAGRILIRQPRRLPHLPTDSAPLA